MLNTTVTMALELNVLVFLSSLFLYLKQYVLEQPVKQHNDDSSTGIKPTTVGKLTKRKDLQKGVLPVTKPPSGYFPVCTSREGLTHTVSDSSLCAHRVDTSSSASSISLIDFTKNPSGKSKYNMGVNKSTNKQQITPSSESLNMAQFETHTSLRIKRPPSGQTAKECFVSKTAKSVSFQDNNFTEKSNALLGNTSENVSSDHEQDRSNASVVGNNQQSQSVAIIADQPSYRWLVETLSSHGVTLEGNSIPDNKQQVVPVDIQDTPTLIPCKPHVIDNMEDEHSAVSHDHQIVSSKESVRVGNIAMLKVNNLPSKQLIVDPKISPNNDHESSHNTVSVITNKTCTISPDSCEDNQNKSPDSCGDNQRSQGESDKSISSSDDESEDKAKSQSSPVTTYTADAEDMKIIAAACYEYVMDMLENWDSLPVEDDNQPYEEDKVVYYLDVEPSPEKPSDPPAADANNEDMQCLAMACYETVMEMIRNGDIYSEDELVDNNPIYYLNVEPSDSFELPLYNPSSMSISDPQQYPPSDLEKSPAEVPSHTGYKTASQLTHSQPLLTEEDTTSQCCVNVGSVDSLLPCSEQTESDRVEIIKDGKAASALKVDGHSSRSEDVSSNDLCQDNNPASNHPFATFIDISDSKNDQEYMKVLESRRQKIKMQLMERDRTRNKKKNSLHKPKDSTSPQSIHTTQRDSEKQLQTAITKNSQYSTTASQEGHVLRFTLGSQEPSQSAADNPLIVNIPSVAMTTALPTPPPLTGIAAAVNAPVVKMTEDHPVPIPYNGPLCYVQPPIKSNKKIICNAISHTCLAGVVNNKTQQAAIRIVEDSPANHFLVLFRDHVGRKFRGIYSFDDKEVHKIFGAGPKMITSSMVSRVYKYNSGSREFNQLPSISISMSADAFTVHNYIWVVAKNKKHIH